MKPVLWNNADYCLRVSLYCVGKLLNNKYTKQEKKMMDDMIIECRLDNLLGHRKSDQYTWSKDIHKDGKSWRYRFWEIFLKPFGIDFFCGLNCDQYRALALFLYLARHIPRYKTISKNIFWGYVLRLGFSPSLTETAIFKPQSLILIFKSLWYTYPIYLLTLPFFKLSVWREYKKLIHESTTNKISLLPTMKILGYKMPSDKYIENVYNTYFCDDTEDITLIRNAMIDGMLGTINDYSGKSINPLLGFPRNLSCPCKSGVKFKDCCLSKLPRYIHTRDALMLEKTMIKFKKEYKSK